MFSAWANIGRRLRTISRTERRQSVSVRPRQCCNFAIRLNQLLGLIPRDGRRCRSPIYAAGDHETQWHSAKLFFSHSIRGQSCGKRMHRHPRRAHRIRGLWLPVLWCDLIKDRDRENPNILQLRVGVTSGRRAPSRELDAVDRLVHLGSRD